ncbi:hypothetical protein PEDI_38020 [Persicobacter diffluens]|uniref:Uncharacterized protein n=1 Tax=Persicobacter diffluens TaxID=981 RepID=A0AAN5AKV7_9BACT|nr:hypothetical protein PEDI_38020 [Persicobacter diffluens]
MEVLLGGLLPLRRQHQAGAAHLIGPGGPLWFRQARFILAPAGLRPCIPRVWSAEG